MEITYLGLLEENGVPEGLINALKGTRGYIKRKQICDAIHCLRFYKLI
jgi:hypothetical protein